MQKNQKKVDKWTQVIMRKLKAYHKYWAKVEREHVETSSRSIKFIRKDLR
jgi:hypothetical protein